MKRNDLSRNSFKNNFLKNIIMRLDFQGVLSSEMETILVEIKKYLKQANFNRYEERIGNEIELNIGPNDINISEPIKEVRQTKVYAFTNENEGYEIELSTAFVILKVNASKYVSFEQYSKIFTDICNIYNSNIDFFTSKRFGLRKINFCFLENISNINKYFEKGYFDCNPLFGNANLVNLDKRSALLIDDCAINIFSRVELGRLKDKNIYKIILDTDIYSESQETIERMLFVDKDVSQANEKLFDVYIDAITPEFSEILKGQLEAVPEELLGVESNE